MAEKNEEEDDNLQTIELTPPHVQPKLTFQQDEEDESGSETGDNKVGIPPIDVPTGTQLQGRQARSLSATTASLRDWSVEHMKVTRQFFSERFGKGLKTVDPDLDVRLSSIRDTQKKYNQLISLMTQLQGQLMDIMNTQQNLAEHFAFMSIRCPELTTEFEYNSKAQKKMTDNGNALIVAIQKFIANVQTVSAKAIEDTLNTAKSYETSRVLYDAYRHDLEIAQKSTSSSQSAAAKLEAVKDEFEKRKARFEQLRKDLDIKLKLLDENRLKVMQKQLIFLNTAFAHYYAGNHSALETILTEFNSKLSENGSSNEPPAWLEEL